MILYDRLHLGFPGTISRSSDKVVSCRINGGTTDIEFGDLVAITDDNKYELFIGTNECFGVACNTIKSTTALNQLVGVYPEGHPTDVLERGSIIVKFDGGTPVSQGQAYYKLVDGKAVVTATVTAGNELNGVVFTTGETDDTGVIEVTLLTRGKKLPTPAGA